MQVNELIVTMKDGRQALMMVSYRGEFLNHENLQTPEFDLFSYRLIYSDFTSVTSGFRACPKRVFGVPHDDEDGLVCPLLGFDFDYLVYCYNKNAWSDSHIKSYIVR